MPIDYTDPRLRPAIGRIQPGETVTGLITTAEVVENAYGPAIRYVIDGVARYTNARLSAAFRELRVNEGDTVTIERLDDDQGQDNRPAGTNWRVTVHTRATAQTPAPTAPVVALPDW